MDLRHLSRPTRSRWTRILGVAFVMYVLSVIDRTNIAMAIPAMRHDLGLKAAAIGFATSTFFWGYIVLQIPAGRLAGVWSAKRVIMLQLILWCGVALSTVLVTTEMQLIVNRFALGVAEGGVLTCTIVLIRAWFTRAERARANTLFLLSLAVAPIDFADRSVTLERAVEEVMMPEAERIDPRRAALIAYDVCRRALTPSDPARRAAMRPVLDAWIRLIAAARAADVPVIYTTPVSRADGADVVMLPTDLSAETGIPPLTNGVEGTPEAGFPDEIAPRPEDYVYLKRRPSAFHGTGVAELLRMLRRDVIVIGGGATNRGVETSVREAFSNDLACVVVRECCWGSDAAAHAYSLDKAMKMYARIRHLEQVEAMLRG